MRIYASAVLRATILLLVVFVVLSLSDSPSEAQKRCVYNCTPPARSSGGGGGGAGGGVEADPYANMTLREVAVDQNERGVALLRQGDLEEAYLHFERAIQMDPSNATMRKNFERARALRQGGTPATATKAVAPPRRPTEDGAQIVKQLRDCPTEKKLYPAGRIPGSGKAVFHPYYVFTRDCILANGSIRMKKGATQPPHYRALPGRLEGSPTADDPYLGARG